MLTLNAIAVTAARALAPQLAARADEAGFSVNLADGSAPEDGYMISLPDREAKIPLTVVYRQGLDAVLFNYLRELRAGQGFYQAGVARKGRLYFGGWVEGDTLVLDLSVNYAGSFDAANSLARKWGQRAFYAVEEGRSYNVDAGAADYYDDLLAGVSA